MPCFHPLHAFLNPYLSWKETGSKVYKITSIQKKCYRFERPTKIPDDKIINPLVFDKPFIDVEDSIEVPCGYCLGCRLDHSQEWAARIMAESQYYDQSWFLTLTYDDDHVHKRIINGQEVTEVCYDDLRLFWARLRKAYPDQKLKYFACTEYGKRTGRAHAHAIVFGLPLRQDDLVFYKTNFQGDFLYKCPKLNKIWQQGFVTVGIVNEKTAAYVARYTMKKSYRPDQSVSQYVADYKRYLLDSGIADQLTADQIKDLLEVERESMSHSLQCNFGDFADLEKEKLYMSRGQAIGTRYWSDHWKEIVRTNELFIAGRRFPIPRAFALWLRKFHFDEFLRWQSVRQSVAKKKYDLWLLDNSESYRQEFLDKRGQLLKEKVRKLSDRENLNRYDSKI